MRSGPWVREYTLGVGIRGANNRAFYSLSLPAHLLVVVGIGGAPKGPCPSGTWDVFLDIYTCFTSFTPRLSFPHLLSMLCPLNTSTELLLSYNLSQLLCVCHNSAFISGCVSNVLTLEFSFDEWMNKSVSEWKKSSERKWWMSLWCLQIDAICCKSWAWFVSHLNGKFPWIVFMVPNFPYQFFCSCD
jgi:hypothetical protein